VHAHVNWESGEGAPITPGLPRFPEPFNAIAEAKAAPA
jgi:hypothetical protein